ncbi:hypothetical protein C1J03_07455 [Sulfitobacter sp. SK012]|uniref:VCBS domain-containing protein n=1 Tax=Sulfitobacter sp. SK012 TaxID=1389005 RepID=UPI000E0B1CD1|nr:VCBS domain-containing protein [Sulfitobacter sp. SK012]AXI45878.1 hypothetical protein C1J03_07455 [Sulfitobacter sp. SK012]
MPVRFGSFSDDNITATDGNDLIISFKGDDFIFAGEGDDLVIAGSGDDTVYGGGGNDTLIGGSGDDSLFGQEGDDRLYGGSGNDDLSGGAGEDLVYGGSGFDTASFDGSIFDYNIASDRKVTRITDDQGAQDYLVSIEAMYFGADNYTLYLDGRNNAVLFTGDDAGSVTEDAETPATGTLTATDFDGTDGIVAAAGTTTYGSYSVGTDGGWTYTLNDANATIDALNAGIAETDSFVVMAEDGTEQTVTIGITGANDGATFGGDLSGAVTENEDVDATGIATVSDVDQGQGAIVASSGTTTYGSYSIDTSGVWSYSLDDANPSVDALAAGDPLTDSFVFSSDDGTEQVIDIAITGADDGPAGPVIIDLGSGTEFTAVSGLAENFVLSFNAIDGRSVVNITNFDVGEDRFVITNFELAGGAAAINFYAFGEDGILNSDFSFANVIGRNGDAILAFSNEFFTQVKFIDENGARELIADDLIESGNIQLFSDFTIPYETVPLEALAADDLFVIYADDLILV